MIVGIHEQRQINLTSVLIQVVLFAAPLAWLRVGRSSAARIADSGITFTTPGKPVEFLGLHFQTTESRFIPPVAGVLALVGGIVSLVVKPRWA